MPRQRQETGPAIVVGADGSTSAAAAVWRAANVALARGADLHIVNGFPRANRYETRIAQQRFQREVGYAQMGTFEVDGIGDPHTIAKAILEDAAREVRHPDLRIFMHAINARPHKALRWVAQEKQAQLIVVGNKRPSRLLRPLGKSVAELVQVDPPCRVQVVDTSAWWNAPRLTLGAPGGDYATATT